MNRSTTLLAAVALATAGAAGAHAQGCIKADQNAEATVTGTLTVVKFKHPGNGSNLQAYVVRLPKPICADVTDVDSKVQRINRIARVQVAGELDGPTFAKLVNKRVTVGGTFFGQHTAYHITPILVQMKSIDRAR